MSEPLSEGDLLWFIKEMKLDFEKKKNRTNGNFRSS